MYVVEQLCERATVTRSNDEEHQDDRDAAFTKVVVDLHGRLLALAAVITADAGLAEDAVAGAYAATWSRFRKSDIADLDRYLWRAVARQSRRVSRRHRRPWIATAPPPSPDPADVVADDELLAYLLARLPADQRTVVSLRYVGGFSVAEVAELLSISPGTVKSRLSRAVHALRAHEGTGGIGAARPATGDAEERRDG